MRAYERLLNYVTVYTTSDETTGTVPSTRRQFDLANLLTEEMKQLGIENPHTDEKCYVYGWLPATAGCEQAPALGFIAHMDTAPDCSGENVHPMVWKNYDGGEIRLKNDRVLSPEMFQELPLLKGRTLITSDGTTLLGADDKAGIAEILTMAETLVRDRIPHGKICIAFTPDEEIGGGAEDLDLEKFGAQFAYTVDGGAENEIEYENFNAAGAAFTIRGLSVHPGEAKNKMVNAALIAAQINAMLPAMETPANTQEREGFYHMTGISGNVEEAKVTYIIRDHDAGAFEAKKQTLRLIHKAAEQGADLICFPEIQLSPFFPQYMGLDVSGYLLQENDPAVRAVQAVCRENRIFASPNFYLQYGDRCYDTSLLIDDMGEIIGRQKMVHIAQCPCFYEQDYYAPSDEGFQVFDTPFGRIGIVVCFDRHYPESIRTEALRGADLILIPTANTTDEPSGRSRSRPFTAACSSPWSTA